MAEAGSLVRRWGIRSAAGLAGLAALIWVVPLFHVVSLESTREQAASAAFNAAGFADEFWSGPLMDLSKDAVDIQVLAAALRDDFDAAAIRYGHRLGLSGSAYYLVSGRGEISAVEPMAVKVKPEDDSAPEVAIGTGPVFGNAIRDGSGLLDISDFANIQDFNAISAEINLRVEEHVLPVLRENARPGAQLVYIGAVELTDSGGVPAVFNLVPVVVEFQ